METGRLAGIARHDRPRGAIETLDRVAVTRELGVTGDHRGAVRPGKARRQLSLIEAESWQAALHDLAGGVGEGSDAALHWSQRRANFLIEGLHIPREAGTRLRIGADLVIEITMECDPCSRMDEIRPGLREALVPDWRGGCLGFVVEDGSIAVGDVVRIEK